MSSNSAQNKAWRARNRAEKREPSVHGYSGYVNYGCRCDLCTDANTEHQYQYQQTKKETQT